MKFYGFLIFNNYFLNFKLSFYGMFYFFLIIGIFQIKIIVFIIKGNNIEFYVLVLYILKYNGFDLLKESEIYY